ncbi:MAG: type IX secretion system membrane protein PorP/SprF [Chitinophagaceae bacterium]|nr:MAG: type IX secretion system membrane protein PorP/SprF [Chitinophagaceae bacterium]
MKRFLVLVGTLFFTGAVVAQQRPHYTQYILNNYVLNPALSGIENYTDLKISTRDQWVGLNGAPKTNYLSIHKPLGKADYKTSATSYNVPGENPRGNSYWENYTASDPHHGIGMILLNDKAGSFNRFSLSGTYAYHIGLSGRTNLSAGFSGGITMVSIDKTKQDFTGTGSSNDPATYSVSNELNKIKPEIGAGVWLYSANYFLGISAQQIIPHKLMFVDDAAIIQKGAFVPHLFLTGGYRFLLSNDINALPSFMLKYVKGTSTNDFQPEGNLKLQYRDLVWLGGSYRYEDGYAGMLGLNVANLFNVGYSYDYTTTHLNTMSRGTHEIVIGFLLGNNWGDTCPRNVW